ncbi:MAG: hypothetical protein OFPII_13400 [Osedax symbiont Rs1]|nr:MAG: hypothetical protein OFPII_13400 [Osedax symbiont Rs1]
MSELPPRRQKPKFKEHKPLFNRTYLKYLAFIVAIAIVILSKKPPAPLDQPQALLNSISALQVLKVDELPQSRLLLSFLSNPALSPAAKVQRSIEYQALRQAAANSPHFQSVLWTYDRLEVELRWPASAHTSNTDAQQLSLTQKLAALQKQALLGITDQDRKLMIAEHYLQNNTAENALLNKLTANLSEFYPGSTGLAKAFQTSPAALLITDSESSEPFIKALDQQFAAISSKPAASFPSIHQWRAGNTSFTARSEQYKLLIASELNAVSNQTNRLELLSHFVLSEVLKTQNMPFRLIRQPIFSHGYQVLILSSKQKISSSAIEQINRQLQQADLEDIVLKVKDRLLDAYRSLVQDRERLFKLYSKKQFYRLITESDSEYQEQLDTITLEQIKQQIDTLLSAKIYSIRLQPS